MIQSTERLENENTSGKVFSIDLDESVTYSILDAFKSIWKGMVEKKQKIEDINTFAYERFEAARENCLPIHDIDRKRWTLQKHKSNYFMNFRSPNIRSLPSNIVMILSLEKLLDLLQNMSSMMLMNLNS